MSEAPTLFTNPPKTLYIFSKVLANYLKDLLQWMLKHFLIVTLMLLPIILPRLFTSPLLEKVDNVLYFMAYWIILGIASSVGLGTGLHTFVLYLGPHIAKITLYSYECKGLPVYVPSKYNFEYIECPKAPTGISFLQILLEVQFEAFLWGLGTAIGELPPYFVARAAALANQKPEELEEITQHKQKTLIDKVKLLIYNQLQKHAFITVLLCASIPNPLFDLAGITCGHFLIPFLTFFLATSIGKAIIKVHIQMLFVIFVFSEDHVMAVVNFLESNIPALQQSLTNMLERQKKMLQDPSNFKEGEKPFVAQLWDYFILLMISYFIVSIINSLVAQYVETHKQQEEKKQQTSLKDKKSKRE